MICPEIYRQIRQAGAVFLLVAGWAAFVPIAAAAGGGKELRILARFQIPEVANAAPTDIRWATDTSVFLSRVYGGVKEVALAEPLREVRTLVSDVKTLEGPRNYFNLAVSSRFLAVAADTWSMAWRPVGLQKNGAVGFYVQPVNTPLDIDVSGDRIVVLGEGRPEKTPDTAGGIAFLGRLSATGMKDYRPILLDLEGVGTPVLMKCGSSKFGAARFLPDGSFVVVPGFQPGAHLFDSAGNPLHTWSARETGLSTDCSKFTKEESDRSWSRDVPEITAWFNQERILDDILPLAEGPGLLIRTAGPDGRTSWDLRILHRNGNTTVYKIPFTGGPEDRLSGDVRAGRVVLLRSSLHYFVHAPRGGEIVLLEMPTPGPRPGVKP